MKLVVPLLTLLRPWTSLTVLLELIHLFSVLTDSLLLQDVHVIVDWSSTVAHEGPNHFNIWSGFTRPLTCFLMPLLTPDLGVNTVIVHLHSSSQVNTRLMQSWVFSCWLNICHGGVRDSVWVEEVKYLFGCVMWRMWPCWLLTQPDRCVLCCHSRP